jgi:hypothetical protein
MRKRSKLLLVFVATSVAATMLCDARTVEACGGCFVPPAEATVVTDHRMALSLSKQQTILWDQIRYSGDPREFAWVLPVRAGARIEVANDEFFSALDTSTQPIVYAPQRSGGVGCGLTGCANDMSSSASESAGGPGQVQVLSQSVVGPYEQVTLRATDDDALTAWLRRNAFTIPTSIEPTIEAYVREGFDFIALKLRPQCGERSMRPVRVVSPGAEPTLPLRMVAAGVGAQVGIILYVITEGKYRPQNFPSAMIEDRGLRWERFQNKSNYEALSQEIMAREGGRTWITEYAGRPQIPLSGTGWQPPTTSTSSSSSGAFGRANPGLGDVYYGLCYRSTSGSPSSTTSSSSGGATFTPCPKADAGQSQAQSPPLDSGSDSSADAATDAGDDGDDGGEPDSGPAKDAGSGPSRSDAGAPTSQGQNPRVDCAYLDDLDVALEGLHRENVWVTRLRSVLPTTALTSGDLRLEPSRLPDGRADQEPVSNVHWTPYYADEDNSTASQKSSCEGAPKRHRTFGSWAVGIASALFGVSWLRRRRRRER